MIAGRSQSAPVTPSSARGVGPRRGAVRARGGVRRRQRHAGGRARTPRLSAHGAAAWSRCDGGSVTVALDQVPTTLNDHTVAGDTAAGRMVASAVWAQVFRVGPGPHPPARHQRRRQRRGREPPAPDRRLPDRPPGGVVRRRAHQRRRLRLRLAVPEGRRHRHRRHARLGGLDARVPRHRLAHGLERRATVTVVFRTPFADWASLFDDLLPAHIAERVGWNHGFDHFDPAVLVSGGPWEVASWKPGSEIVLGRNPRVVGEPRRTSTGSTCGRSRATGALTSALGRGRVQVAYPSGFDQSFMAQASSSSVLQTQVGLGTRMLQLEFNVRHAPLNAATVRQGIAHAIDRAGLVESHRPTRGPFGVGGQQPPLRQRPAGVQRQRRGVRKARPGGVGPPARAERLDARRARVRGPQHGKPVASPSCGPRTTRGRPRWGPIVAAQLVAAGFDVVAAPGAVGAAVRQRAPRRAPSTSPSCPSTPARTRAHSGDVFSTSPAIIGGAETSRTGRGSTTRRSMPCSPRPCRTLDAAERPGHLPTDRPGAVDGHAHAAAVRRADDAGRGRRRCRA